MHDRHNPQRYFLRRVGNQIVPRGREAQRARGEVGAAVALMGELNERFNGCLNVVDRPISGKMVVFSDELPNGVEVNFSFRVKIIPSHRC